VDATNQVETSATSNLDTARIMSEMATRLSQQIGSLEQSLAVFSKSSPAQQDQPEPADKP
jgi:hypothetical protein